MYMKGPNCSVIKYRSIQRSVKSKEERFKIFQLIPRAFYTVYNKSF